MTSLRCECGASLRAENVNIAAAVASCPSCGSVFSIAQTTTPAPRAVPIPDAFTSAARSGGGRDGSYRELAAPGSAVLEYRWFRGMYVLMVLFFAFWDSICGVFVVTGVRAGGFGWATLLLPHVWVGVIGSYWVLAHLFNRTRIELGPDALVVRSGPIPWRSLRIARADIADFDAGTFDLFGNAASRGQQQLRVIGHDRRARRVLGAMTGEEAAFAAGELRRVLQERAG